MAVFTDMKLSFPNWWVVFSSEAMRGGSLIHVVSYLSSFVLLMVSSALIAGHWASLPEKFRFYMLLLVTGSLWRWLWFWIAEAALWRELLWQFPIQRPSILNWVVLVLVMPFLSALADIVFYMLPT